jgi:hypothetical protein
MSTFLHRADYLQKKNEVAKPQELTPASPPNRPPAPIVTGSKSGTNCDKIYNVNEIMEGRYNMCIVLMIVVETIKME